ncbi:MAG: cell division protein SepF [Eubacteriaceae bacterium]|nr:cell division protein SepF [Eubacteriaceae bacterium]
MSSKSNRIDKLLNAFGFELVPEEAPQASPEEDVLKSPKETKLTPDAQPLAASNPQVVLTIPEKISDATKIAEELTSGKTVIINVEKLEKSEIVRLIDFISGAKYVLKGKMKEISDQVLVVTPANVDVKRRSSDDGSYSDSDNFDDDYDEEYEY